MNKQIIPIFFTFDNNYSNLMKIAVSSIKESANLNFQYNIHILYTDLSNDNINEIKQLEDDNFKFFFLDLTENLKFIFKEFVTRDYYSESIYFRLFIPNLFPEYKKAIYLDSDVIVLKDISKLFSYDLGNNLLGAIKDESVQIVPEFIDYVENFLGVTHDNYFNSGVLLMNLEELRKFDFERKFLNLFNQYKFIVAPDQDILNVICKDRVFYLPITWDKMPFPTNIDEKELNLIHYNLSFKPWHYDGILYEKYFYRISEKINLMDWVEKSKEDFDDEKKYIDKVGGEKLIKLAGELAKKEDSFFNLVKIGKITL